MVLHTARDVSEQTGSVVATKASGVPPPEALFFFTYPEAIKNSCDLTEVENHFQLGAILYTPL